MLAPYFRRKEIIDYIKKNDIASVSSIAEEFDISISTARRDINMLLEEGVIEKKRGGILCIKTSEPESDGPHDLVFDHSENPAKLAIAQKAAKTVSDYDVIFIDIGTTVRLMIPYITAKNVTIVTPCILVPQKYFPRDGITCILLGGQYYPSHFAVKGPITESHLEVMYFDKAYLGANGYSIQNNCAYVYDISDAHIKDLVKKHSKKTYLLAESEKENEVDFYKAFDLDNCTVINEYTEISN